MASDSFSFSSVRRLNQAQDKLNNLFDKLSSGKRITRAADDPAGLAVAEALSSNARNLGQATRNISDTQSALNIADGALAQVSEIGSRLSELATQASNGTLSDTQRQALQQEYSQLTQEVQRITGTTEFNGKQLLNGEGLNTQAGTGSGTDSQINAPGVDIAAQISDLSSQNIGTQAGAQAALGSIQGIIDGVSSARSTIGAVSSRLSVAAENNQVERENTLAAESRIRDADIAEIAAKKVALEIQSQSSKAVLAQANNLKANTVRQLLG